MILGDGDNNNVYVVIFDEVNTFREIQNFNAK